MSTEFSFSARNVSPAAMCNQLWGWRFKYFGTLRYLLVKTSRLFRVALRLTLPAPPNHWWPVRNMHDVMSKKTEICIKTTVSTSNLARLWPIAVYFPVLMRPGPKADHSDAHRSRVRNVCGFAYIPFVCRRDVVRSTGAALARCQCSFRRLTFQLLKSEPQRMNSKALRDCKRQTYDARNR
jgi:hypothetical protein